MVFAGQSQKHNWFYRKHLFFSRSSISLMLCQETTCSLEILLTWLSKKDFCRFIPGLARYVVRVFETVSGNWPVSVGHHGGLAGYWRCGTGKGGPWVRFLVEPSDGSSQWVVNFGLVGSANWGFGLFLVLMGICGWVHWVPATAWWPLMCR